MRRTTVAFTEPVYVTALAQLHTELVRHVVQFQSSPASASRPLQLGDGACVAPSGDVGERIHIQLEQLGRGVGLRLAERMLFLADLHPNPLDPEKALDFISEDLWIALSGSRATVAERSLPVDTDLYSSITAKIRDTDFVLTRHLDLTARGRSSSFAAGGAATGVEPRHIVRPNGGSDTTAVLPQDYLTFMTGLIEGALEVRGFVPWQAKGGTKRQDLAEGRSGVEVLADFHDKGVMFQVTLYSPRPRAAANSVASAAS
jgi:hypothetical protein